MKVRFTNDAQTPFNNTCMFMYTLTWIGLAAVNKPAMPPPTTRPSGPANDTLNPPVLLLTPPLSETVKDPVRDNISNRPCMHEIKTMV